MLALIGLLLITIGAFWLHPAVGFLWLGFVLVSAEW